MGTRIWREPAFLGLPRLKVGRLRTIIISGRLWKGILDILALYHRILRVCIFDRNSKITQRLLKSISSLYARLLFSLEPSEQHLLCRSPQFRYLVLWALPGNVAYSPSQKKSSGPTVRLPSLLNFEISSSTGNSWILILLWSFTSSVAWTRCHWIKADPSRLSCMRRTPSSVVNGAYVEDILNSIFVQNCWCFIGYCLNILIPE